MVGECSDLKLPIWQDTVEHCIRKPRQPYAPDSA